LGDTPAHVAPIGRGIVRVLSQKHPSAAGDGPLQGAVSPDILFPLIHCGADD
jgi:hypothetical protein